VPTPEEPIPVNDSESIERTANLKGSFDLQFWGETYNDLIDEKDYPGGNLSYLDSQFTVNAPVYENHKDAAYENTEGNHLSAWEVPLDDTPFSLGTLTYRNDKVEDDFGGSRANHGANFNLSLDDPIEATVSSNFYLDITNRRDDPETIKMGFRGGDPKRLQLRSKDSGRGLPIFLDYMGAREVGASKDTPLKYSIDVLDNTTAELELFGRLYTTDDAINRGNKKIYIDGTGDTNKKDLTNRLSAEFTPAYDLTLKEAAQISGYDHFNWYQKIIYDYDTKYYKGKPVTDPITGKPESHWIDNLPYYYNETIPDPIPGNYDDYYHLWNKRYVPTPSGRIDYRISEDEKTLRFSDAPLASNRYKDPKSKKIKITTTTGETYEVPEKSIVFQAYLMGVDADNPQKSDGLWRFDWYSDQFVRDIPGIDLGETINQINPFKPSAEFGGNNYVLGANDLKIEPNVYADDIIL
jgi:hypothetical protein